MDLGIFNQDMSDNELAMTRTAVELYRDYDRLRNYVTYVLAEAPAAMEAKNLPRLRCAVDTARKALR